MHPGARASGLRRLVQRSVQRLCVCAKALAERGPLAVGQEDEKTDVGQSRKRHVFRAFVPEDRGPRVVLFLICSAMTREELEH